MRDDGQASRIRTGARQSKRKVSVESIATIILVIILSSLLLKPRVSLSHIVHLASVNNSLLSDQFNSRDKLWSFGSTGSDDGPTANQTDGNATAGFSWYSEKPRSLQTGLVPTWTGVLAKFMADISLQKFATDVIEQEYTANLNKVQESCVLVKIRGGDVTFKTKFPAKRHTRFTSVVYVVKKLLQEPGNEIPDVTFLVMLNDGYAPHVPTFGSARHWKNWNELIPVPMGNTRGQLEGSGTQLEGWDQYMESSVTSKHSLYPWKKKRSKAFFRGTLAMQSFKLGTCNADNNHNCVRATKWDQVNRGVMYKRAQARKDLFDIAFTKHASKLEADKQQFVGAPMFEDRLRIEDYQLYKYIICVGSNQDWAERLRNLMFMNSAVVLHMSETQEFFYPLLIPWRHIIPTSLMFADMVKNVKWALKHDAKVQQIVTDMNKFAKLYLSEHSMKIYWKLAIVEYAARQRIADRQDSSNNLENPNTGSKGSQNSEKKESFDNARHQALRKELYATSKSTTNNEKGTLEESSSRGAQNWHSIPSHGIQENVAEQGSSVQNVGSIARPPTIGRLIEKATPTSPIRSSFLDKKESDALQRRSQSNLPRNVENISITHNQVNQVNQVRIRR
jgi:Glycosyl transferase family 90